MVRVALRQLAEEGRAVKVSNGNNARYRLAPET